MASSVLHRPVESATHSSPTQVSEADLRSGPVVKRYRLAPRDTAPVGRRRCVTPPLTNPAGAGSVLGRKNTICGPRSRDQDKAAQMSVSFPLKECTGPNPVAGSVVKTSRPTYILVHAPSVGSRGVLITLTCPLMISVVVPSAPNVSSTENPKAFTESVAPLSIFVKADCRALAGNDESY